MLASGTLKHEWDSLSLHTLTTVRPQFVVVLKKLYADVRSWTRYIRGRRQYVTPYDRAIPSHLKVEHDFRW